MRLKAICLLIFTLMLAACSSGGAGSAATPVPATAAVDEGPALQPAPGAKPGESATAAPSATVAAPAAGDADQAYPPPMPTPLATPVAGAGYPPPAPELPSGYPGAGAVITPSPEQERLIEAAARDLSAATDVPMDEIRLVSAVSVTWPDGALGCPEPGMGYTQALVDGLLITLSAGGKEFTYHTDGATAFVLCQGGVRVSSGTIP